MKNMKKPHTKKLHLISLGCTKNLVDSEVMLGRLSEYEIANDLTIADLIIVNTCGFIEAAKQESIDVILRAAANKKKSSLLVVSGCLTERYREELAQLIPEVDIFTGVGDYNKIDELVAQKQSRFTSDVFLQKSEKRVITGSLYHAYIKIAEGCNQQCSFCAIPSFKGRLKSRPIETIANEVKTLIVEGYFDFTFIAQDTSSYGRDLGNNSGLIDLISAIERIDGVKRARICYLYPSTISNKTILAIERSTIFANYFDIPIQHASDRMLKIMKRGLNADKTFELINRMRSIDNSYIRTSFIVGHPQESEQDFEILCNAISSGLFDRINIFAYSDEEQTASYNMQDKIAAEIINDRVKTAAKLVKKLHKSKMKNMIGKTIGVTIDGESDESEFLIAAKHIDFAPEIDPQILINDSEIENIKPRMIARAKITAATETDLIATLLQ